MNILESVKMAVSTLLGNKMRSSLTILGIVIGNASVIATIGIGEGAQKFIADEVNSLGTNVLFVLPGSPEAQSRPVYPPQTLVLSDAEAIVSQVPSVTHVAPMLTDSQLVSFRGKNASVSITGTTPDILIVRSLDVGTGRFITDLDLQRQVIVLGSEVAVKLFGDRNPVGETVRLKNISMEVIGVMQAKGSSFGENMDMAVYVPLMTMANQMTGRMSPFGTRVTFIALSVDSEAKMSAAQFQIENLLRLRHKITNEDDFTVRNQQDLMNILGRITGALTLLLAAIASISLFVGGIGIMNIMLVSVTERTQEIGLRKAIGATEQDILIQFTIEAVILSIAGGLIGTAIGVGGISMIGLFSPFKASVSPMAILVATGVSGGIGLFFGVFPARRAAKLDPIVALRTA
jgi:putative ABC transport system permease protein